MGWALNLNMQSAAKHIRFFRRVYDFAPCRNIASSVMVCISNTSTMFATKSFPFSFTNPKAISTHLRSISRWYYKQPHTFERGFVSQILAQLVKTPTVQFCFLCLTFWLCCFANVAQIFNSNTIVFTNCFFYNLLCYVMVVYGNEPSLYTTKPFQEFLRSLSAFALNAGSYFRIFFANFFKLFGIKISTVRQSAYISLTKITADKFLYIFHIIFNYVNGLKQVKFAFSKKQICFAFDVWKIVRVVANKRHFQTTTNRPDGNNVVGLVGQDSTIVGNATKWFKGAFGFSIQFVGVCNFRNAADNYLATQFRSTLNHVIAGIVKFKLLKRFLFPSYIGNKITCFVCFFNGLKQRFSLFIRRQQLYFQREFHNANIQFFQVPENYLVILKAMGVVAYLPPSLRHQWVSRSFL